MSRFHNLADFMKRDTNCQNSRVLQLLLILLLSAAAAPAAAVPAAAAPPIPPAAPPGAAPAAAPVPLHCVQLLLLSLYTVYS